MKKSCVTEIEKGVLRVKRVLNTLVSCIIKLKECVCGCVCV